MNKTAAVLTHCEHISLTQKHDAIAPIDIAPSNILAIEVPGPSGDEPDCESKMTFLKKEHTVTRFGLNVSLGLFISRCDLDEFPSPKVLLKRIRKNAKLQKPCLPSNNEASSSHKTGRDISCPPVIEQECESKCFQKGITTYSTSCELALSDIQAKSHCDVVCERSMYNFEGHLKVVKIRQGRYLLQHLKRMRDVGCVKSCGSKLKSIGCSARDVNNGRAKPVFLLILALPVTEERTAMYHLYACKILCLQGLWCQLVIICLLWNSYFLVFVNKTPSLRLYLDFTGLLELHE